MRCPNPKKSRRPPHTTGPKPINWKSQPQKPSSRPWPKPQHLNSKTSINEKECTGFNNTRFFLLQFWLFVHSGGMCMSECIMWVMFHFSVLDMCLWWVPCRPWTANMYISYNRSTHQHQWRWDYSTSRIYPRLRCVFSGCRRESQRLILTDLSRVKWLVSQLECAIHTIDKKSTAAESKYFISWLHAYCPTLIG